MSVVNKNPILSASLSQERYPKQESSEICLTGIITCLDMDTEGMKKPEDIYVRLCQSEKPKSLLRRTDKRANLALFFVERALGFVRLILSNRSTIVATASQRTTAV